MAAKACVAEAGTTTSCRGHAQGDFCGQCPFPSRVKRHKDTCLDPSNLDNGVDMVSRGPALQPPTCGPGPQPALKKQMRGSGSPSLRSALRSAKTERGEGLLHGRWRAGPHLSMACRGACSSQVAGRHPRTLPCLTSSPGPSLHGPRPVTDFPVCARCHPSTAGRGPGSPASLALPSRTRPAEGCGFLR